MSSKTLEKTKMEIIPPIYDIAFKAVFGRDNLDLVKDFLQSVLSIPAEEYDKIEFSDTHLHRNHVEDKLSIVDLLIHTKSGKIIHVEMQMADKSDFRKRAIYYNSCLLVDQLHNSDEYAKLEKTISILIVDFNMFKSPRYMRKINYKCEDGELFDGLTEFHVLEIPKVPVEFDGSKKCEWAKFFASKEAEEFDMCAERNPEIKKAVGVLRELSEDEANRLIAMRVERLRRDRVAEIKFGVEQGLAQGIEQGIAQGEISGDKKGYNRAKIETASAMLQKGFTVSDVSEITGLDETVITSLE